MKALHVAVVGCGTAGQAAALMLAADGHRVEVFERAARPGPVGAGLLLQPTGWHVLRGLGLESAVAAHAAPVRRLFGDTPQGRPVLELDYLGLGPGMCGHGVQRGALFEILHQAGAGAYALHTGHTVRALDADTGRLHTDDGRTHGPFDLVLLADGAASTLRGVLGAPGLDRPYPWGALWCLIPQADWPHVQELRQRYRGAQRMIGLLPVGTRPGNPAPKLSFFWSLPTGDFERWRSRGLAAFRDELAGLWPEAGTVLQGLPADTAGFARASYRDVVLRRWWRGRVVALGDAAHAMSPQLGQGVNFALLDAQALRDALRTASAVPVALAEYERQRQAHVTIYHRYSRWLTPLFQSHRSAPATLRDLALWRMGRLPLARRHMLQVLAGLQRGWWSTLALDAAAPSNAARAGEVRPT